MKPGFVKVRLIGLNYKLIAIIECPLTRDKDWVVHDGKLYRVHAVWLYDKRMPRVQVTPFPYPPPPKMR